MKQGKKLMILLLVLAVLVGATAVVKLTDRETAAEEETAKTVFSLNRDSVTALGWDYSEEISFTAGETGWVCDQDQAFPVDETYLETMLDALQEVTSAKTIENPENLDQYGLEIPVCVINVSDGEAHTLSIGLETAVGGERYFSNGDGNVYLVDDAILDAFQYGLYDILQNQTLPEVENLTGMTVKTQEGGYSITRMEDSGLAYSDDYVWFMDGKALDNSLTETLLSTVTNLNLSRCADYNAGDLSAYGLDDPAATVTILDGGEAAFTLELGSTGGDSCYLRLEDSKMIYQTDGSLLDTLRYTTYADLQPTDVLLMDWDTVQQVDVSLNGGEYTLERTVESVTADDGTVTEETVWLLDGTAVEFAPILESITSMDSTGYAAGITPEAEAEITFRIYRDQEQFSQVELSFYAYNSSACLVTLDGTPTVTVSRTDAAQIVDNVNSILK